MRPETAKLGPHAPATFDSPLSRRKISGAEWDRLVAEGFFGPGERLELLDGEILVMSPIGDPHDAIVTLLAEILRAALLAGYHVREEKALDLGEQRLSPDIAGRKPR